MSSKMSSKKVSKIMNDRQMGLYHTQDTLDESILCAKQMASSDICYTLIHHMGFFNVYNAKELQTQLRDFKSKGVKLQSYNIFEKTINNKTFYMAVFQPEDLTKCSMGNCPLALAHGVLVTGYTYIFKSKGNVENIAAYLNK
jgi:hypothetical protein